MMSKKVMHSFKIEQELIDRAKQEAKRQSMATSVFIRQAILEKLESKSKIEELERRIESLEKSSNK
ncbi:MAG: hypothetical protein PHN32_01940 [Actinomycetota bacterium]|nr:hypothetical protein [Actinomycetota bacterium]